MGECWERAVSSTNSGTQSPPVNSQLGSKQQPSVLSTSENWLGQRGPGVRRWKEEVAWPARPEALRIAESCCPDSFLPSTAAGHVLLFLLSARADEGSSSAILGSCIAGWTRGYSSGKGDDLCSTSLTEFWGKKQINVQMPENIQKYSNYRKHKCCHVRVSLISASKSTPRPRHTGT